MLSINYIEQACPEIDLSHAPLQKLVQQNGRQLLTWAIARDSQKKDCMCVCAPMLGIPKRIAVVNSVTFQSWVTAANLYITKTEGEPYEFLATLFTHPGKYVRFNVHPVVEVSFDDLVTGEQSQKEIKGLEARAWEVMSRIMDGETLDVVDRDFRTVRRDPSKVSPNAKCPCGSGLKYKKCCGRV